MKAYYKTKSGEIVELDDLTYQDLFHLGITELILNENCQSVYCWNNQLTELILNENCQSVYCWNNQLTELILNENCQSVYCWNNQLKEFDTNKAQIVECDMKSLTNLNKVEELYLWI